MSAHVTRVSLGTQIVRNVLHSTREDANQARIHGWTREMMRHTLGLRQGQIIIARHWLDADPVETEGADNEIGFLLDSYLTSEQP